MKREEIIIAAIVASGIVLYIFRKPLIKEAKKLMNRSEFIEKYGPVATAAAKGSGLFPSLFIAQAILESSDNKGVPGNSGLAKNHNNFFGIKADKSWKGAIAKMPTREVIKGKSITVIAPFRKYGTPEASFMDRVNFLTSMSRYKKAGVFDAANPIEQAQALQKAGYATDPNYSKILQGLIEKYDLTRFDHA